jgi:NAD(P)-dependent dehydrogenase (short-subunit alcohol dehydrogenase family)
MTSDATPRNLRAVVIGASGGIGSALVAELSGDPAIDQVMALARSELDGLPEKARALHIDLTDETSIASAAKSCADGLDLVIVASGMLHAPPKLRPEKSWDELDAASMAQAFAINCTGPALAAKHFLPLLARDRKSVFAALSARVGSISDNRLGGWYAYRASKAALNMMIRSLAIELGRKNPHGICVGLHPGTVDTPLSAPFQARVPAAQLFTPERAARELLSVIRRLTTTQSGQILAWDGRGIAP